MRNWRPLMVTITCAMADLDGRAESSTVVRLQQGANGADGGVEPARDLAVGILQRARMRGCGVEVGGKLGAVTAERMQLRGDGLAIVVGLAAALDRAFERIERHGQAPGGGINRAYVVHRRQRPHSADHFTARQISCVGKRLEAEAYVLRRLSVNIGAKFFPAPVHGVLAGPGLSWTPEACVVEAGTQPFPAKHDHLALS